MPQTFVVDQAATFQGVAFLSSEPRRQFGTDIQEQTKDGLPKWEIQLIASFRDNFGRTSNEVIKVGYAGPKDPGEGLAMYTPVQLVNFTVGVMERRDRRDPDRVVGVQVWYRCDGIRPLTATGK